MAKEEEKKSEENKDDGKNLNAKDPSITSKTREMLHKQEHVTIEIPSTEKDKDAVPVTINGHVYNIPRDKPAKVPLAVVHVLENAKTTTYALKKREAGEGNELVGTDVQRHAYVVKGK